MKATLFLFLAYVSTLYAMESDLTIHDQSEIFPLLEIEIVSPLTSPLYYMPDSPPQPLPVPKISDPIKRELVFHLAFEKNTLDKQCTICKMEFRTKKLLDFHYLREHHHEKTFSCEEETCKCIYKTSNALVLHRLRKHRQKRFFCQICNIGYALKCDRDYHFKRTHSQE